MSLTLDQIYYLDLCPVCGGYNTKHIISLKLHCKAVYCYDCDLINIMDTPKEESDSVCRAEPAKEATK